MLNTGRCFLFSFLSLIFITNVPVTHSLPLRPRGVPTFDSANWIWTSDTNILIPSAPAATHVFRKTVDTPTGQTATSADVLITVDNSFMLYLNGQLIEAPLNGWQKASLYHITNINPTRNVFAVKATNDFAAQTQLPSPAGLIASIQITTASGTVFPVVSDGSWRTALTVVPGFELPSTNDADSQWSSPALLGIYGVAPWLKAVSTLPLTNVALQPDTSVSSTSSSSSSASSTSSSSTPTPTTDVATTKGMAVVTQTSSSSSTPRSTGGASAASAADTRTMPPVGPIIGGVIGAIIIVALFFMVLILLKRRRKDSKRPYAVKNFTDFMNLGDTTQNTPPAPRMVEHPQQQHAYSNYAPPPQTSAPTRYAAPPESRLPYPRTSFGESTSPPSSTGVTSNYGSDPSSSNSTKQQQYAMNPAHGYGQDPYGRQAPDWAPAYRHT